MFVTALTRPTPESTISLRVPWSQDSAAMPAKPSPTTNKPAASRLDEKFGLLIYDRYTNIFEPVPPRSIPEDCVRLRAEDVLFLIEAPLNAVEVYEAILKPASPFEVHTARLVPRKTRGDGQGRIPELVAEYLRGQGRLAGSGSGPDREVSFIVVPRDTIWQLQMYYHFLWPVQLQYMSIPVRMAGTKTIRSPYALVCYSGHKVYHKKLNTLLRDFNLAGCGFERSLLQRGTEPLPETLKEYMGGEPGKDAARSYYVPGSSGGDDDRARQNSRLRRVTSTVALRRVVSRVSLRRSRSAASMAAGN